jgi:exodeoxyribonuclease VII large subunit
MTNIIQQSSFFDVDDSGGTTETAEALTDLTPTFDVSGAIAVFNEMFDTATPRITVVGEVANFKVNQNKWVFFDLKDDESSLSCFLPLFNLRVALENGMKIAVTARPNITKWGKFSLTVQSVKLVGEGSILRSFEMLREKLSKEGLFEAARKRPLPKIPSRIGVISSTDAAGYKDFVKIVEQRWPGVEIVVAHVQVQGDGAAEQIVGALKWFNQGSVSRHPSTPRHPELPPRHPELDSGPGSKETTSTWIPDQARNDAQVEIPDQARNDAQVDVIAILRGGGSRDDLVAFDDEQLVREIAASRIPTITGIGHEIDTTLADLAADVRASTPSNAAEILVPDWREVLSRTQFQLENLLNSSLRKLNQTAENVVRDVAAIDQKLLHIYDENARKFAQLNLLLHQLNPREILRKGYAIVWDKQGKILKSDAGVGDELMIENARQKLMVEVRMASSR